MFNFFRVNLERQRTIRPRAHIGKIIKHSSLKDHMVAYLQSCTGAVAQTSASTAIISSCCASNYISL